MAMELLDKGVKVSRAAAGFTAGGRTFKTGAALVDGSTLGATDLAAIAKRGRRRSPACRASRWPASCCRSRRSASSATRRRDPANPIQLGGAAKSNCSGGFCEALFVLTQKMKIPASLIHPISATDLAAGKLVTDDFTAFINPGVSLAITGGQLTPA